MLSLRLPAALVLAASVLAAPTAAHAARVVTEDAVADAQSIRSDFDEEVFTLAPEHTAADITRTVVAHGARRLRVQVHVRDLVTAYPSGVHVKVRTPDRRFDVQAYHNIPNAGVQLTKGQRDDLVRCPGLRSSVDPSQDRLTVSVPTACLGRPAWVQVGVLSIVNEVDLGSAGEEPYFIYFDDAHKAGGFEDHGVRLGPKVLRG